MAVTILYYVFLHSVLRLLVTANVPSSPILVTLMEAIHSSEMLVLTRATWCNIPEDGILHVYICLYVLITITLILTCSKI
jgi:hypothetical protein